MPATTALEVTRAFQALSDPTRLQILQHLRQGECCVCELMEELDAAQSRLSFHLKTLKDAGLVQDRREGRWVHYSLMPGAFDGLEEAVREISPAAAQRVSRIKCCE